MVGSEDIHHLPVAVDLNEVFGGNDEIHDGTYLSSECGLTSTVEQYRSSTSRVARAISYALFLELLFLLPQFIA